MTQVGTPSTAWRAHLVTSFHELADLPPARQRARLSALGGRDAELAGALEPLLRLDRQAARLALHGGAEASDVELKGQRFDGYRVLHRVGCGGMGTVYLAEHTRSGGQVALKVLRHAALRQLFELEQRLHARMAHPSIVRYHGRGIAPGGVPYFVLEYVEGRTLTAHCAARGSTLAERLRLFRAACEGVAHAHERGVVHRDLKPENVLVRSDGTPRLLDFGIATRLDPGAPLGPGANGTWALTPAYASPEQHRGEPTGVATDIYSLGVMLFELLSGEHPFDLRAKSAAEVARIVCRGRPLPPSIALRSAPAGHRLESGVARSAWRDLDRLVARAMAVDPAARHASVEELILDIDHVLCCEPLGPPQPHAPLIDRLHEWSVHAARWLAQGGWSATNYGSR